MIFVPVSTRGYTPPFRSGKSRFWSKPREGKGKFAATPNLAPVARRVAACGPLCDLAGRRWGTGYHPAHLGACRGAFRCAESEAGERGGVVDAPAPVTSAHSAGSFTGSATGVVKWLFRWAVGSRTEIIPQLREKLRGRGKISRRKMK